MTAVVLERDGAVDAYSPRCGICTRMCQEGMVPAEIRLLLSWDISGSKVAIWQRVVAPAEDNGLIEREPVSNPVAIALEDRLGVVGEVFDDLFVEPTAIGVLQVEWQIPVEERDDGVDAVFEAGVDDIFIVGQSSFVDLSAAKGKDARPRDREGVRRHAAVIVELELELSCDDTRLTVLLFSQCLSCASAFLPDPVTCADSPCL